MTIPVPSDARAARDLGGGFRLLGDAETGRLRLAVGFAPPGWQPRRAGTAGRPSFPGTGLLLDGRWYEIAGAAETAEGMLYELTPWEDRFPLRQVFELSRDSCTAAAAEHRRRRARERRAAALAAAPVLTGLLPAADQRRLERDYGVPARRATAISALVLLFLSIAVLLLIFALTKGLGLGAIEPLIAAVAPYRPAVFYLALESIVRFAAAASAGAVGSLPVALPILAWRAVAAALAGGPTAAPSRRGEAQRFAAARDEVRSLPPRPGDADAPARLEVVSLLPKEHWTANVTGIRYRGADYLLTERQVVAGPDGRRHRFVLEQAPAEMIFRSGCDYRPEEVRELYRRSRQRRAATWVETAAVLWGLLDGELQRALGRAYRYEPRRFTRWTIAGEAVLGAYNLLASLARGAGGAGGAADGIVFLSGLFLLAESFLRWRAWRAGEVRGSLLGLPLAPFARRALRWAPPAASGGSPGPSPR